MEKLLKSTCNYFNSKTRFLPILLPLRCNLGDACLGQCLLFVFFVCCCCCCFVIFVFFCFFCFTDPPDQFFEDYKKEIYFLILFLYFHPTHASTVLDSNYVFFFFVCSQVDYIAILKNKIHSDHFPIEVKSKETRKACFLRF